MVSIFLRSLVFNVLFYAVLVFASGVEVSARPSDSIALALRTGSRILCSDDVLDEVEVCEAPGAAAIGYLLDKRADALRNKLIIGEKSVHKLSARCPHTGVQQFRLRRPRFSEGAVRGPA